MTIDHQETTATRRLRKLPSLHERTLLLILVPFAAMAVLVAAVTVLVAKNVLDGYAEARNRMALDTLALAIEPVWSDATRVQEVIANSAHSEALANIWLVSATGIVLASSDRTAVGKPLVQPANVSQRQLISDGPRLVCQGDGRIVREIAAVVGAGAVVSLGFGLLITAWAVTRLSRALAMPVAAAAVAATAMAEGDFAPAQKLPPTTVREGEQLREALRHTARRLEELTSGLEGEVAARTAQLEVTKEQAQAARALAEEASRSKSLFLASMSHELRTPLNAIIGYAEMIAEDLTDTDVHQRDLGRIGLAARHLLALINDILDYTKLEAGRMRVHRESYAVRQVVDEAVAAISPLISANHNRLSVVIADDVGNGFGDALKLRQILINLLGNAAKFTTDGELQIETSLTSAEGERQIRIAVSDTGIGMDDAQRGQLFKPFATSEAQRRQGGTGLGLAICFHYCQLMGGSVICESERGRGSTFIVQVPLELTGPVGGTSREFRRIREQSGPAQDCPPVPGTQHAARSL